MSRRSRGQPGRGSRRGTAYDIAGQGKANVEATWQAFQIACRMGAARNRSVGMPA